MKDALVIALSGSLAAVVVLSLLLGSAIQDQRTARAQAAQLHSRLKALEDQVAALCELTNALTRQLQPAPRPIPAPEPVPAQAEAKAPAAEEPAPKLAPFQAPAYLGTKPVGSVWVVPTQVKRDPKTGRLTYQPVIRLPETLQTGPSAPVTNVVETPAPAPSPQPQPSYGPWPGHYHYYHYSYWRPWWWGAYAWTVRLGPDRSEVPAPSRPAVPVVQTGGPWTPVALAAPAPGPVRGILAPPAPGSPGIYVPPGLR